MGMIPKAIQDQIAWYEAHLSTWATNATAIGTTTTAVTDLQTKTESARAGFNSQQEAAGVAKSATSSMHTSVTAMLTTGSDIIKSIKTKAATAGTGVYDLANIPAPATPTPMAPPGTPTDFKVVLNGDGSITLTWKCANPVGSQGTIYQVYRAIGSSTDFAYIGGSGEKQFEDPTIPAGSTNLTYKVQAVRSTASGPWATFNVYFGTASGGGVSVSVVEGAQKKPAV